jgi:hypothetical protein
VGRRAWWPDLEGPAAVAKVARIAAATALATAAAVSAEPSNALASWGRTLRLDGPQSRDILPAQIAFSPISQAAVTFGVQDSENATSAGAFVAVRLPTGGVHRARRIAHAREPLAVGFDGTRLAMITGNAPRRRACCATAAITVAAGAGHGAERALLAGRLTGDTDGAIVPLAGSGLMAAVSTQRGVWVDQTTAAGRFEAAVRVASGGAPQNLAAAPLSDGGAAVAWSTALGSGETTPRRIEVAFGSAKRPPRAPHVAVTVPVGHSVDELVLTGGAHVPTLAWVESWFGARGDFHSRVETAPAVRRARGRAVSPLGELASELSAATGADGRQVLAWDGCSFAATCVARAASRPRATVPFGTAELLGAADGGEGTTVAVSARGLALVGRVDGGNVVVSTRRVGASRFGRAQAISRTGLDADPVVAFGPGRLALAVWTQGTLAPSVFARPYFAR